MLIKCWNMEFAYCDFCDEPFPRILLAYTLLESLFGGIMGIQIVRT